MRTDDAPPNQSTNNLFGRQPRIASRRQVQQLRKNYLRGSVGMTGGVFSGSCSVTDGLSFELKETKGGASMTNLFSPRSRLH